MKVVGDINYSGRLGKLVFYTVNGVTYGRRVRIPGKEPKPRTEKQRGWAGAFGMAQKMYAHYREKVSADIWRLAGKAVGRRGNMLFWSVNCGCFEGGKGIGSPETFRFAEGELLLPWEMKVEALGGGGPAPLAGGKGGPAAPCPPRRGGPSRPHGKAHIQRPAGPFQSSAERRAARRPSRRGAVRARRPSRREIRRSR